MKKYFLLTALLISLSLPLRSQPSENPIAVVSTFSILSDWIEQVGGQEVDIVTLVSPLGDAHTFEPTVRDQIKISKAQIIFEIGHGFETWLNKLVESSKSKAKRISVSNEIKIIQINQMGHQEVDPHVWHDIQNVRLMVIEISKALEKARPEKALDFKKRADLYLKALEQLEAWLKKEVSTIPSAKRKLVTSHDTFRYFGARYGFEIIDSVLGSVSTEAEDPSSKRVKRIIDEIRALHVPAIFAETMHQQKLVERIASEAGVKIGPALYTDALGPKGSPASTYIDMITYNINAMVGSLR